MGSSRVLLRYRQFRSAQIDPSRRAVAEGLYYVTKTSHKKKSNITKELEKGQTRQKQA